MSDILAHVEVCTEWKLGHFIMHILVDTFGYVLHLMEISVVFRPYIKDVRKNFGILDPLPPCPHFG